MSKISDFITDPLINMMERVTMKCTVCPRNCNIDRSTIKGYCGMGDNVVVAKTFLHKWEEPCISGTNGSGTVFFSGCNLKCVYCQNYQISHECFGKEITTHQLTEIFLKLQNIGANNINLVTPSHFIPQIKTSLTNTNELKIPVVYNSNSYEKLESLKLMEGLVDVYLPDLKYFNNETAKKYSGTSNYFETATEAILEMHRQVGSVQMDENGLIKKGIIIRHLILPGHTSESIKILDWIKNNLPSGILISLMSQYIPYYKASLYPEIDRRIIRHEYDKVVNYFIKLGFEDGYIQERESATEEYIPDFNLEGV